MRRRTPPRRIPLDDATRELVKQTTETLGAEGATRLFGIARHTLRAATSGGNLDPATRKRIAAALASLKNSSPRGAP